MCTKAERTYTLEQYSQSMPHCKEATHTGKMWARLHRGANKRCERRLRNLNSEKQRWHTSASRQTLCTFWILKTIDQSIIEIRASTFSEHRLLTSIICERAFSFSVTSESHQIWGMINLSAASDSGCHWFQRFVRFRASSDLLQNFKISLKST